MSDRHPAPGFLRSRERGRNENHYCKFPVLYIRDSDHSRFRGFVSRFRNSDYDETPTARPQVQSRLAATLVNLIGSSQ